MNQQKQYAGRNGMGVANTLLGPRIGFKWGKPANPFASPGVSPPFLHKTYVNSPCQSPESCPPSSCSAKNPPPSPQDPPPPQNPPQPGPATRPKLSSSHARPSGRVGRELGGVVAQPLHPQAQGEWHLPRCSLFLAGPRVILEVGFKGSRKGKPQWKPQGSHSGCANLKGCRVFDSNPARLLPNVRSSGLARHSHQELFVYH